MAIRNVGYGGTDFTDGEVLTHTDLNDTFDASLVQFFTDSTSNSHTGDTSETTIASLTITSGSLGDNATLNVALFMFAGGSGDKTYRLKVDGVTAYTSPTSSFSGAIPINAVLTGVDVSSDVSLTLTTQHSQSAGTLSYYEMTVRGYRR